VQETRQRLNNEKVLDEATLLALSSPSVGSAQNLIGPRLETKTEPGEEILDSAGVANICSLAAPDGLAGTGQKPKAQSRVNEKLTGTDTASATSAVPGEVILAAAQVSDNVAAVMDGAIPGQPSVSVTPDGRLVAASDTPSRTTLSGSVSVDEVEQLTKQIAAKQYKQMAQVAHFCWR
jgi:hypothetical protein